MKLGTQVRNLLNDVHFKKIVKTTAIMVPAIKRIVKKPSALNIIDSISSSYLQFSEEFGIYSYDFFRDGEWVPLYTPEFATTIYMTLKDQDVQTLKTSEKSTLVQIVTVDGCTFGWLFNCVTNAINSHDGIYCQIESYHKSHDVIKNLLWKKLNSKHLVAKNVSKSGAVNDSKAMHIEADELTRNKPSKLAIEIANNVQNFNKCGESVSILLYGSAGTGKSTLARTIIHTLDYNSIRIRVEDVANIGNRFLNSYIELFEPDAIVFDDFDRIKEQELALEMLEFLKQRVKVIIATVNDPDKLDSAILRPGRFDEHVSVNSLDEDTIRAILGEFSDAFHIVKDWPVAYIEQYVKINKFCDEDTKQKVLESLVSRLKKVLKESSSED